MIFLCSPNSTQTNDPLLSSLPGWNEYVDVGNLETENEQLRHRHISNLNITPRLIAYPLGHELGVVILILDVSDS